MKIIAITACPTGVAHTFMAKSALEKAAKELGHTIKVETQGALGIENEITTSDIEQADILILGVEVGIDKKERFDDMRKVNIPINTIIKSAKQVLIQIEQKLNEQKK